MSVYSWTPSWYWGTQWIKGTDDENGSNFETPKEVTPRSVMSDLPRSVISDFNIDRLYEYREEDKQLDTTDMTELESDHGEKAWEF